MKKLLLILALMFSVSVHAVYLKDLQCLSDTVYFEARGESILGQAMVAHTVINRMKDSRWPNTICDVVYQGKQFSWTQESNKEVEDLLLYTQIQDMVYAMLDNVSYGEPTGINHYLRCDYREKVSWWKRMKFAGQIDSHCFYIN